ncbi:MAG TPA: universal stress protein [Pirellulales bacterium]|nr:universal stress protein [Pirellulales bacterium]
MTASEKGLVFRSVLVPLDGSAFGEQALPVALSIARRAQAALFIAHVHVPYAMAYGDSLPPFADSVEDKIIEREQSYLSEATQRLTAASSVPVSSRFVEGAAVAEAIETAAAVNQADLIVMTTHGHGPLSRLWLGSVADELIRRASLPVLLVRPREATADLDQEAVFQHILVPLDGSPAAEEILEPAATLGRLMQARYTLLGVTPPLSHGELDPTSPAMAGRTHSTGQWHAITEAYLNRVAARLQDRGLLVQARVVARQQVAPAIIEQAETLGVDLIAMTTHGRRGLPRMLLGSVADKVVRGATTPVLLWRAQAT